MLYGGWTTRVLMVVVGVILLATNNAPAAADLQKLQAEQQLRRSLLQDYDKTVVPGTPTIIHLTGLKITNFLMHEETNTVELHTWFATEWKDERLRWAREEHREEHRSLNHLAFDSDAIWRPDLTLYHASDPSQSVVNADLPVLVSYDGNVTFVPPFVFHFPCITDLTYWPHDVQNCSFKVGSWVHHDGQVDLSVGDSTAEMLMPARVLSEGRNATSTEWEITETSIERESKYYSCCPDAYANFLITLILTRNAPAYTWTIKVPVVCLSLLTLVVFLLPPAAAEKLTVGCLCLILHLIFVAYTSHVVAYSPSHTPLVVRLVSQQLLLVLVSVLVAALVVRLARDPHPYPLPNIIKSPLHTLSCFLCLSNYTNTNEGSGKQTLQKSGEKGEEVELGEGSSSGGERRGLDDSHTHQWMLLAAVLDRLVLILYLVICIITLIRFTSIL
ncbi:hypothetical protein OTU49_007310 [Cherax quadricarinatus]|uniref:Uncharacterized protein n=1 Tax=Cherax quadricarinatus TaxID=27406 RepID=A0AAW0WV45_CHEQU